MPKTSIIPEGSGKPLAPYVPGSMADGIVYVAGTLPFDKDNNVVHVGDPEAQTRHVLETIKGGCRNRRRHHGRCHLQHDHGHRLAHYGAVNKVYAEYFPGEKPARYCIQCGLVKPDALVEIASIAHVGKG